MLVVILAFVLFRADTLTQGLTIIKDMFTFNAGVNAVNVEIYSLLNPLCLIAFFFALVLSTPVFRMFREKVEKGTKAVAYDYAAYVGALIIFALSILSLMSSGYNPFIYFRF